MLMSVLVKPRSLSALVPTRSVRTQRAATGVFVQRDMCAKRESVSRTSPQVTHAGVSLSSIHSLVGEIGIEVDVGSDQWSIG